MSDLQIQVVDKTSLITCSGYSIITLFVVFFPIVYIHTNRVLPS